MKPIDSRWTAILVILALAATLVPPASADDFNFNHLVSSIEQRYDIRHEHIPFLGLASFCAHVYTRGGVRGLRIADFPDAGTSIGANDLDSYLHSELGESWSIIVRSHTKSTREDTIIYARSHGDQYILLIADLNGNELSLVKLGMDAEKLRKWISKRENRERAFD